MKKNQKTYLLLVVVVIVWGTIGYQIYQAYSGQEITTAEIHQPRRTNYQASIAQNDYQIEPDYRDPFLGKIYRKPKPKKRVKVQKPPVVFPNIVYKGVINGETDSYIISINGIQEIFALKQEIKGVKLVRAYQKTVVLQYQKETKKYYLIE